MNLILWAFFGIFLGKVKNFNARLAQTCPVKYCASLSASIAQMVRARH